MAIDVPTILVVMAMACGTVGAIFLAAWSRKGGSGPDLRVGCATLLMAIGILLILFRDKVPDRVSIDLANALTLLGLGFAWSAARTFEGRRAPIAAIAAGAVFWLAACAVPVLYEAIEYRVAINSLIGCLYAFAAGTEFLRPSEEDLDARRPIAVLCFLHGLVTVGRGLFWLSGAATPDVFAGDLVQGLLLAEPIVVLIAFGILGVALVRGRAENILRRTAETDALTGILNRRAMIARSERALARARLSGQPAVLLVFDLDHFKAINDRFGHSVGDRALRTFADVAGRAIRAGDLFGRIGGEEFAALLVGVDADTGQRIAERIRVDFSSADVDGAKLPTTVSIGVVATMPGEPWSFEGLLARADEALYRAKRAGRDRVVRALALAG